MKRVCIECLKEKELSCFPMTGKNNKYYKRKCKGCIALQYREKYRTDEKTRERVKKTSLKNAPKYKSERTYWATFSPKGIYQRIKRTTKIKGYKKIISQKDFIDWYLKQERKCVYCDIDELTEDRRFFMKKYKLSIDRIKSDRGYVKGNLCLACNRCNQKYIKPKYEKNKRERK